MKNSQNLHLSIIYGEQYDYIFIIIILASVGALSFVLALLTDVLRWTELTEILLQLSLVVSVISFILIVVWVLIAIILSFVEFI